MSWNYRVIKNVDNDGNENHAIYEVFYDSADESKITFVTLLPTYPMGQSLADLKEDILHYVSALQRPVLDMNELNKLFEEEQNNKKGEQDDD